MNSPLISVVIPAYNQAGFLGEAIQSVLDQAYPHLEVIVVNDASPDHTAEIVKQFDEPRVKYIEHPENRGLPASRNTGMKASSGEIIALLDSDDYFHPEKLETHLRFLKEHSDVGVTYNPRFNLNHSSTTIRDLWRPPKTVGLADFVLGFPFSPSDMVLRREWAFKVDLFREEYVSGGEDLDFPCRLALAGCKFASVDRALNYRRFHAGKKRKNLPGRIRDYTTVLDNTFNDVRCSPKVRDLREKAFASYYLEVTYLALSQGETSLGQTYVREVIKRNPSILDGTPSGLVNFFLKNSIADENVNHEKLLQRIFAQLPSELAWLSEQYDWAVARGYLAKGVRAIIWNREKDALEHFKKATTLNAEVDDSFLQQSAHKLLSYESEFGVEAATNILQKLVTQFKKYGTQKDARQLKGLYLVNLAFKNYYAGMYDKAQKDLLCAFANDPKYLSNRGALTVLLHSIISRRQ